MLLLLLFDVLFEVIIWLYLVMGTSRIFAMFRSFFRFTAWFVDVYRLLLRSGAIMIEGYPLLDRGCLFLFTEEDV